LAAIAAQDDVIERPGIVNSWLTSHGAILHNKLQLCKPHKASPRPFYRIEGTTLT
jgi:hypothetical protein